MALANKCTNCAEQGKCKMEGTVVVWRHCHKFRLHPDLAAQSFAETERQKAYRLYEQQRLAAKEREAAKGPEPKYQHGRRAVEQIDRDGNRVRLFPGGAAQAIYELGLSEIQVYKRLAGRGSGDLRGGGFIGLRYVQEEGV